MEKETNLPLTIKFRVSALGMDVDFNNYKEALDHREKNKPMFSDVALEVITVNSNEEVLCKKSIYKR